MNTEFKKFDEMMKALIKVPHSKIKAKLDAEKAAKSIETKRPNKRLRNDERT